MGFFQYQPFSAHYFFNRPMFAGSPSDSGAGAQLSVDALACCTSIPRTAVQNELGLGKGEIFSGTMFSRET